MRTCLSGLWDELTKYIIKIKCKDGQSMDSSNINEDRRNKICRTIEYFYNDSIMSKPEHLAVFYDAMCCSDNTLEQAATKAIECASECCLCIGCIGCALKFYNLILSENKRERELPAELRDYFGSNSQLYYYLSAYKSVKAYRKIKDTLICLKGFSSTTPAIYSASFGNTCTGGGIYLNVGGYGIVIDPGIGFVDSMHKQGIFIEDIDAVIVTHNHLDHNADLSTISALQHDVNRYYEKQVSFYKNFFPDAKHKKHSIYWILDIGTKESTKTIVDSDNSEVLIKCDNWKELSENISMKVIETQHMVDGVSYGVKFKGILDDNEIQIGYTSDTKFFAELSDFFIDTDILIFNISDIYEKDVRGTKSKNSHLGYDGSINLLVRNSHHPQLAIASEFCCSNGDYRMSVSRKLQEQVGTGINIIPGEIGLKVDLSKGGICCSRCKRAVPISSVSVIAPEREFGPIQYICDKCRYSMKK